MLTPGDAFIPTRSLALPSEICYPIPDGCAPVYVSKAKPVTRKRGRPVNPKVENQEL